MENEIKLEVIETLDLNQLSKSIDQGKEVQEKEVENSLDYNKLTEKEKAAIDDFVGRIDPTDTNVIITFGAPAQMKISRFSDEVLNSVRTKDIGAVGDLLASLTAEIRSFDGDISLSMKPGLFNSLKKQISKLINKFNKIETNINSIEKKLEAHKRQMMKDIAIFDEMYMHNLEYFKELSLYIIAGAKKVEELNTVVLPQLVAKAQETGEQNDIQAVNDMRNMINRFEKKLYDLKSTRIISIQMAPQIRIIQHNDAELVDKIQSSIINTIPLWKNQMVIALGLTDSMRALEAQTKVTDLTNEMLQKNSEILKQGSIKLAKESERPIVDLETLRKTNQNLIDTLTTVVKIHAEGREKRTLAEVELNKIEQELKDKLLELKTNKETA